MFPGIPMFPEFPPSASSPGMLVHSMLMGGSTLNAKALVRKAEAIAKELTAYYDRRDAEQERKRKKEEAARAREREIQRKRLEKMGADPEYKKLIEKHAKLYQNNGTGVGTKEEREEWRKWMLEVFPQLKKKIMKKFKVNDE